MSKVSKKYARIENVLAEYDSIIGAGKLESLQHFVKSFLITDMYLTPDLHTGKNRVLSPSKIREECRHSNPQAFDVLFSTQYLFKSGGIHSAILTLHPNLTYHEIMSIIDSWAEFKMYLHMNGLILSIYDGAKYGFMSKTANSIIMICKKNAFAEGTFLDGEIIRYYEKGHIHRYMLNLGLSEYRQESIIGSNKFITYGVALDKLEPTFRHIYAIPFNQSNYMTQYAYS